MSDTFEIVDGNIQYAKNAYFSGIFRKFVKTLDPIHEELNHTLIHIEKPVFAIETLHFCYVHMIEHIFRYFWVIQDLLKSKHLETEDIVFFVRRNDLMAYATKSDYILAQYFSVIDFNNRCYRGAWNDLLKVINKNNILFESFVPRKNTYKFQHLYILGEDFWQHSFWNNKLYYPIRTIPNEYALQNPHIFPYWMEKNNEKIYMRYTDAEIQTKLQAFRKTVLDKYLQTYDLPSSKRKVILINRKNEREFPNEYFQKIVAFFKANERVEYNGVYYLEEINFQEQLKLFNTNDVFVMMHGAGCANILWSKPNSILVQYDVNDSRFSMYNRLAVFTKTICYNVDLSRNNDVKLLNTINWD